MCEPTAIIAGIGLAIQVGGQIVGHVNAEDEAAKNERLANETAKNNMGLLNLRQQQELKGANQTVYQMDLEARKADAQTRVAAGEAGVAGASVDALLNDIERQRLNAETGIRSNAEDTVTQLQQEKKVVKTNRQSQINSVPAPNPWATGLKIGGSAVDAANSYYNTRSKGAK